MMPRDRGAALAAGGKKQATSEGSEIGKVPDHGPLDKVKVPVSESYVAVVRIDAL